MPPTMLTPLMTGRLTFRIDDCQAALHSPDRTQPYGIRKTGTRSADLEITIDLDELRALLVADAMHTKAARLTRCNQAIRVRPIAGTLRTTGTGRP